MKQEQILLITAPLDMKALLIILLSSFFYLGFAQEKVYYIMKDLESFKLDVKKGKVISSYLHIENRDGSFDNYTFHVQYELDKMLDDTKNLLELEGYQLIDEDFLKKFSPCDLHSFLSEPNYFYLVKKEGGKIYGWNLFYEGTSRNRLKGKL